MTEAGDDETLDEGALTLAAIAPVRDPTARRTLEQAEALIAGLRRAHRLGTPAVVGVSAAEADALAREALDLIARMADRDAKADVFHAAVRVAGQSEQALRARVAALVKTLRRTLSATAPELADLGVPPDAVDVASVRTKPARPPGPLWSGAVAQPAGVTSAELLPSPPADPEDPEETSPRSSR
jgi:hypothetical protein